MPGLAHFCEHLLFMVRLPICREIGSLSIIASLIFRAPNSSPKKMNMQRCVTDSATTSKPVKNSLFYLFKFLAKNNGSANAYTSTSNTNYYFNVTTSALAGALERFSGFFHSPLFSSSCTLRELNAVNSEHQKNHQSDLWRIFQLNKHLSRPGHVWSKFGSGNQQTLSKAAKELRAQGKLDRTIENSPFLQINSGLSPSRIPSPAPSDASNSSKFDPDGGSVGREIRRRLVEWWSKEYCASRMRLCIIGRGGCAVLHPFNFFIEYFFF